MLSVREWNQVSRDNPDWTGFNPVVGAQVRLLLDQRDLKLPPAGTKMLVEMLYPGTNWDWRDAVKRRIYAALKATALAARGLREYRYAGAQYKAYNGQMRTPQLWHRPEATKPFRDVQEPALEVGPVSGAGWDDVMLSWSSGARMRTALVSATAFLDSLSIGDPMLSGDRLVEGLYPGIAARGQSGTKARSKLWATIKALIREGSLDGYFYCDGEFTMYGKVYPRRWFHSRAVVESREMLTALENSA